MKEYNTKDNIFKILLYCLTLTVALGFNDLMITIFKSEHSNSQITKKIIYVLVILCLTIMLGYIYKKPFNY